VNIAWLTKQVTADELRADADGAVRWKRLLDEYLDGDEVWEFTSPPDSWREGAA
jgi:hypothetical protein